MEKLKPYFKMYRSSMYRDSPNKVVGPLTSKGKPFAKETNTVKLNEQKMKIVPKSNIGKNVKTDQDQDKSWDFKKLWLDLKKIVNEDIPPKMKNGSEVTRKYLVDKTSQIKKNSIETWKYLLDKKSQIKRGALLTSIVCLVIFLFQNFEASNVKFLFWEFQFSKTILFLSMGAAGGFIGIWAFNKFWKG